MFLPVFSSVLQDDMMANRKINGLKHTKSLFIVNPELSEEYK